MKLLLVRDTYSEISTLGVITIEGRGECHTLEDTVRPLGTKIYGKTAIPEGEYEIIIDMSNRFKIELPRLLNVPGFEGIRIHPGNKAEDTDGCILVGNTRHKDWIGQSRLAFNRLFEQLEKAYQRNEKITIEIKNGER